MAISTEPYLLIKDAFQSPFNVGQTLYLQDFNPGEVAELNRRHGAPFTSQESDRLWEWTGGHPFLTRLAFYFSVEEKLGLDQLISKSLERSTPFGEHLTHLSFHLKRDSTLRSAMGSILDGNSIDDESAILRLLKAGLIKAEGDQYLCRCALYAAHLQTIL